jgi:MoaA/NifB/PqqE/SkfB family radical SAM enzyme
MNSSDWMTVVQHSPVVIANGVSVARQYGHIKTGMRVSRPNMIYVTIAERCNLRCKYCYSWKSTGENELPTQVWIKALDELLSWAKRPKLNFSGGEPFMRKDIFDILSFAIKKGALTGVVTNAYAMTPKMAPRVAGLGLSNLNVSIDSLDPEVFDFMRAEGREGHTERVIESILRVVSEIRRQGSNTKVFLKTVVCGRNAESLVPLVRFVEEHGITGIVFQPLNRVFADSNDYGDEWYKHTVLWPEDPGPLADAAQQLIELKQNGAPIMNTDSQLASWGAYFEDPINGVGGQPGSDPATGGDRPAPCRIGHTHLYLSVKGNIHLCWEYPPIGNIAKDSIRERWTSDDAEKLRARIARCTKPCTVSCLLDRGLKDTVSAFVRLVKPNENGERSRTED